MTNQSKQISKETTRARWNWLLMAVVFSHGLIAHSAFADTALKSNLTYQVRLPSEALSFPEPLPPQKSEPGFKFRGTKGYAWTPEQYMAEIPVLASYKMNFLMNCYLSLFTQSTGSLRNEWWKPLPDDKKKAYAEIFRSCRDHGITYCFAVHPQLGSARPLNPLSAEDIDQYYQHFAWAQSEGVRWFSISLDDVSWGTNGPAVGGLRHARLVNTILARLRQKDPKAQIIFCPGPYYGDGTNPQHRAYLSALGREMDPDVYVFWTGDGVVGSRITTNAAASYKSIVNHRLFLWDNYPVNDRSATLHWGPVEGRDPGLCDLIDGYMSNPMGTQNAINRLPLATCADYAYNPWDYDPDRSIGQAIFHLGKTDSQRLVLKDLVELYPGFVITGGNTGTNPVRVRFERLMGKNGNENAARELCRHLEEISARFNKEFPDQFQPANQTVENDIVWMKKKM